MREFTRKLPNGGDYSAKNCHLPELIYRERRAMARLVVTRCFKSYDVNASCNRWWTSLTMAATCSDEESLILLCERTDVLTNKQDGDGYTALVIPHLIVHIKKPLTRQR